MERRVLFANLDRVDTQENTESEEIFVVIGSVNLAYGVRFQSKQIKTIKKENECEKRWQRLRGYFSFQVLRFTFLFTTKWFLVGEKKIRHTRISYRKDFIVYRR